MIVTDTSGSASWARNVSRIAPRSGCTRLLRLSGRFIVMRRTRGAGSSTRITCSLVMAACSWRNRRARKPGRYVAGMRVGILLLPAHPWPETAARVQYLDALGFDHVWTFDHLSWRRYRDKPWWGSTPWLAGVAAITERIRLGTLVTSPTFRHPVPYAKEVV